MTISFFDGFDHYAPNDNSAAGSEIVVTPKASFDKPTADSYYFGTALGCDGTTLVVGAKSAITPGANYAHGTVIVYKKSKFSYDYEQTISMPSDERVNTPEFGYGVAVNGDYIAIGAKQSKTSGAASQGIVFLFKRNGETYEVVQKITPYDVSSAAYFGESISIHGNRMVVGAWQHDVATTNAGKVYVYEWDDTNLRYDLISEIVPEDASASAFFGYGCSIYEDRVFVGSPAASGGGKVYIYKWDGVKYIETQQIEAFATSLHFGRGISGYGNFLAIGAPDYYSSRGSVRIYVWNGESYVHKPEANIDGNNISADFGDSVVINGNELFIGTNTTSDAYSKVFKYELPELNIQPLSFQIGDKFPKDGWISKTSSPADWIVEKVSELSPAYPGAVPGTYILTAESSNSNKELVRPLPIIQNNVFTIGLQVLGKAFRDTDVAAHKGGYLLSVQGSSFQDNIMIYVDRTNLRLYAAIFERNNNIGIQELTTEPVYDSWLSLELQINKTPGSEYIKIAIDGNDPIELFTDIDSTKKVNVINSISVISLKPTGSEIGTNTKTTWKYDNLWISNGSTGFLGALRLGKPRVGTTASSDNVSSSTNLDYAIHSTGDEFAEILAPGKYSENVSINRDAIGTLLTVISKKGEMSRNHKNTLFINEGGVEKVSTTFDSTGVLKSNTISIMNADVGETNQIEVGIRVDETKLSIQSKYWRVNISATNGGTISHVSYLRFFGPAGGSDTDEITALSGGDLSSGYANTKAFTQLYDESDRWISSGIPGWIGLEFIGAQPSITSVEISGDNFSDHMNQMPKDFTIEYSSDGINWVVAKEFSGITDWSPATPKRFDLV